MTDMDALWAVLGIVFAIFSVVNAVVQWIGGWGIVLLAVIMLLVLSAVLNTINNSLRWYFNEVNTRLDKMEEMARLRYRVRLEREEEEELLRERKEEGKS